MGYLLKDLQHHVISVCEIGPSVTFSGSPYEGRSFPINAPPTLSDGLVWEGGPARLGFVAATGAQRADIKLQSARGNGMGWTFTHRAKGRGYDYSQLKGHRSIATFMGELSDAGDMTWANRSGGLVANSIIVPDGVSSQRGQGGLDVLNIQSVTPDYFLGKIELPQMSYLLGKPANRERKKWYDLCTYGFDTMHPPTGPLPTSPELKRASAQNIVGYTFKDTEGTGIYNQTYNDPLGGFAYYTDEYTLTVGQAMKPRPCNENHLFARLSSSRIVCELFANHVKASVGGRPLPIGDVFAMTILTQADLEHDVLTANVSGTVNSIISEMAENGVWRTWWDSRCNFFFIPDYYSVGAGVPSLILAEGPSLIGDLEVNFGGDYPIVNRAEVKGQPFMSFGDATTDPLTTNVNMALGAVYPPGTPKGGVGSDVTMDNYIGRNTGEQARRMYNRANARTTFQWSNFPYPTLAFGMLNRVVAITAHDPKGNWAFSSKPFVVTEAKIDLQDGDRPDGGYYFCSISGIEI